jgi:hypothetical protein
MKKVEYRNGSYSPVWVIEEWNYVQWLALQGVYFTFEKAQKAFCKCKWEFPFSKLRIVKIEKVERVKRTEVHIN